MKVLSLSDFLILAQVGIARAGHRGVSDKVPGLLDPLRRRAIAGTLTLALARDLRSSLHFGSVVTGFIEEPPFLADTARGLGCAICLPLFTLNAGHVLNDIPLAMTQAGFWGPIPPPIGGHVAVPRLIAAALERLALKAAA